MGLAKPIVAQGKKLLMRAALTLAMQTRSIRALGVREVGREAGLNPNTFYRHFSNMDDLGIAILESIVEDLRPQMRDLRSRAAQSVASRSSVSGQFNDPQTLGLKQLELVVIETVREFFDFVERHPEAFILGISELHGASPPLREALGKVIDQFATDMSEDIRRLRLLPMISDKTADDISSLIIRQMFFLSAEYIEHPTRRSAIREQARLGMMCLATGALALECRNVVALAQSLGGLRDN